MRGGAGRRAVDRAPQPSDAMRNPDFTIAGSFGGGGGRDSDASSLCSSRPSVAGASSRSALITDRPAMSAALRGVNAYLSALKAPFSLRPPLPSARDIVEAFRLLLSRLDFPLASNCNNDLASDLPVVLRALQCPLKLPRSALTSPGTPHSWPPLLSALHWLTQLARYSDHNSSEAPAGPSSNDLFLYLTRSYALFISGDDSGVEALDDEYHRKADHQAKNAAAAIEALEKTSDELEAKLHALNSGPRRKEALESERDLLREDAKKFQAVVESFGSKVGAMERAMGEWERELVHKEAEINRVMDENEELKKRVGGQAVSVRDAERMRREMQAVESDILEAENGITTMEERALELEASLGRQLKEMEVMAEQCNLAIRK